MKKIFTLIVALACHQGLQAQANDELTGLIRESFNYFPRIQELNKSAEIGEMRVDVARTGFMPGVSGVASYTYLNPISEKEFGAPGETQLLKFQPYNNYNLNVGVSQLIWDFGRTRSQVDKAKADLLVANQNITSARLQVAAQVASIYYSMIFLKNAIVVQDSAIAFYERNAKIIEGRIKQGDALEVDMTTMRNNRDQEVIRKEEFLRQFNRQMALMKYTTGQPHDPAFATFDFQSPTSADLMQNPEVIAAEYRVTSSKADVKYAQGNRLPNLNFVGGIGFKNGYQPNIDDFRFNYLAGVSMAVPIFQGGRLNKNLVVARKTMELSQISKATLVNALQKDLESVQADLKAFSEQVKNSEGQILVTRQTFQLTRSRYNQGVLTYLDMINASTNLQRANLNKLQYQLQEILAQIELYRLLGVKFWTE
jgi:outer membrane protein TolC